MHRYFQIARLAALKSTHRVKIGACLVQNGKPQAIGFNKVGKTCPGAKWFVHAERDCLMGLKFNPDGGIIYLYRENRLGQILNCKPCKECQDFLRKNKIKKVYFAQRQVLRYNETFNNLRFDVIKL